VGNTPTWCSKKRESSLLIDMSQRATLHNGTLFFKELLCFSLLFSRLIFIEQQCNSLKIDEVSFRLAINPVFITLGITFTPDLHHRSLSAFFHRHLPNLLPHSGVGVAKEHARLRLDQPA